MTSEKKSLPDLDVMMKQALADNVTALQLKFDSLAKQRKTLQDQLDTIDLQFQACRQRLEAVRILKGFKDGDPLY